MEEVYFFQNHANKQEDKRIFAVVLNKLESRRLEFVFNRFISTLRARMTNRL